MWLANLFHSQVLIRSLIQQSRDRSVVENNNNNKNHETKIRCPLAILNKYEHNIYYSRGNIKLIHLFFGCEEEKWKRLYSSVTREEIQNGCFYSASVGCKCGMHSSFTHRWGAQKLTKVTKQLDQPSSQPTSQPTWGEEAMVSRASHVSQVGPLNQLCYLLPTKIWDSNAAKGGRIVVVLLEGIAVVVI